jgi:hypothetical protein
VEAKRFQSKDGDALADAATCLSHLVADTGRAKRPVVAVEEYPLVLGSCGQSVVRVTSAVKSVRQSLPPSSERPCANRYESGLMSKYTLLTNTTRPL